MIGKLYGNENTKDSTRLNHKVVLVESENEHKHELSITIRKGGGGGRGGGGGGGRRGGGGGLGGMFVAGHHSKNVAPSLFPGTHFWVPKFIFYSSLALTILFPLH